MIEKLNERITIEKCTVVTDKIGNHRNTWEEYFTCFATLITIRRRKKRMSHSRTEERGVYGSLVQ